MFAKTTSKPRHDPERLPYEELDPCCQKELDDNKRYGDVTRKLRQTDKTYQRMDIKNKAMSDLRSGFKCECCKDSKDYPILAQLRNLSNIRKTELEAELEEKSDEHNEDSDSDLDIDADFLTPFEQERLNEMKMRMQMLEQAKEIGFTTHVEDSVEHICRDLHSPSSLMVLHLFSPDFEICAQLDLVLERLALTYIGTKFRRLQYTHDLLNHPLLQEYNSTLSSIYNSNSAHALICFVDNRVVASTNTFNEFHNHVDDTILTSDLIKYLDHTHVLSTTMSPQDMKLYLKLTTTEVEEDDDVEVDKNTFCDDPECTRRFPHEHIGRGASDGEGYRSATFMKTKNVGEDALAKDLFLKV